MDNAFNKNTLAMVLISLTFNYFTIGLIIYSEGSPAYSYGYIVGRSMASVLISFVIVGLPLVLLRRGRRKFTRWVIVSWWVLFIFVSLASLVGNMLPAGN